MVFRQSSKQLLALTGLFLLGSSAAFSQGAALEDAEQQRIIEAMSAEMRTLITQNNFTAAVAKANELEALDPENAAAKVWKNYSERQLSGPQESRLQKLIGVSISTSDNIPVAADDDIAGNPPSTEIAAVPPSFPPRQEPTPEPQTNEPPVTQVDDPFSEPTAQPADPFDQNPVSDPFDQSQAPEDNPFDTPENPFDTPPQAAPTPDSIEVAAVPPTTPENRPTPVTPTPAVAAPSESSTAGSSWLIYAAIGVGALVLIGLIVFFAKGKKSAAKPVIAPAPAKADKKTGGKISPTKAKSAGVIHDAVTQAPHDERTKDDGDLPLSAPSFGMADPITRFPKDKKTNADSPSRDGKTSSDQPTVDLPTRDGKTSQDPPSFAEGDDALYQSLADDDHLTETLQLDSPNMNDSVVEEETSAADDLTLGSIALDSDGETKAPSSSPQQTSDEVTGEMSFGSIMFSDDDQTKGTDAPKKAEKGKGAQEDEYNDMSFNSMMFGGVQETQAPKSSKPKTESKQGIPPAQRAEAPKPKPAPVDDDVIEGDQTYSSLMFDGEETVAPPGMGTPNKMKEEQKTGEMGYDDVMFDSNQETLAPGLERPDLKDTQPLTGNAETRKIPEKKQKPTPSSDNEDTKPLIKDVSKNDDDDDVIKL